MTSDLLHRLEGEGLDAARAAAAPRHEEAEIGALTEFEDLATGEVSTFALVAAAGSDVEHGLLSIESPVGRALSGHHAGDTVIAVTPKGKRRLRLVAVR